MESRDAANSAAECVKQLHLELSTDIKRKSMSVRSRKCIETIDSLFYRLETEQLKRTIGDLLSTESIALVFIQYMRILREDEKKITGYNHECMTLIRNVCRNFSDSSMELCLELAKVGMLSFIVSDLMDFQKMISEAENNALHASMSILYNCAKVPDNKRNIRDANTVSVILPYSNLEEDNLLQVKMLATLTLSYIMEETDNEAAGETIVEFILEYLQNAIMSSDHRCEGFSAEELIDGLLHLAANDQNKILIVDRGILAILEDLMATGTESEKLLCVETVWMLSFSKCNNLKIRNDAKLMGLLKNLANESGPLSQSAVGALMVLQMRTSSGSASSKNAFPDEPRGDSIDARVHHLAAAVNLFAPGMKKRCAKNGVETQMDYGEREVDGKQEVEEDTMRLSTHPKHKKEEQYVDNIQHTDESLLPLKHVMISYQWDYQNVALKIKERLHKLNYRVWIDIEAMSGSTLGAMANAVENSDLVLMCTSQKYKDSKYCRTEAEYAFVREVPLIPIKVEQGYHADGWLGALQGTKLYFDCSNSMGFERAFQKLVKEIGERGRIGDNKIAPNTEEESSRLNQRDNFKPLTIPVGKWSTEDVRKWAIALQVNPEKFKNVDGESLSFLRKLKDTVPEFFYRYATEKLDFSQLTDLKDLCKCLDSLNLTSHNA